MKTKFTKFAVVLLSVMMVFALTAKGPYPILILNGQEGSGKSTAVRACRSLIDPSLAQNNCLPGSVRDLFIYASSSWIVDYDNLSDCKPWLSDALCLISTGGANAPRTLYSNDDQAVFKVKRPVMLAGIDHIAKRSDFAERSIILDLEKIKNRVPERVFWEKFNEQKPALLGALCDAVSCGLRNLKCQELLSSLPRMADFAEFIIAAEDALPWEKGAFMDAYKNMTSQTVQRALDDDVVANAVLSLMSKEDLCIATPTVMLAWLEQQSCVTTTIKGTSLWPKAPNKLREMLNRSKGFLEKQGITMNLNSKKNGMKQFIFKKIQVNRNEEGNTSFDKNSPLTETVQNPSMLAVDNWAEEIYANSAEAFNDLATDSEKFNWTEDETILSVAKRFEEDLARLAETPKANDLETDSEEDYRLF